ncbi:MAG: hypothetical protein P0S96_00295 [Simkaniaceae bacterium]|nr:hypothetical protein [Candidatus Sacchlamyda saccharinae]
MFSLIPGYSSVFPGYHDYHVDRHHDTVHGLHGTLDCRNSIFRHVHDDDNRDHDHDGTYANFYSDPHLRNKLHSTNQVLPKPRSLGCSTAAAAEGAESQCGYILWGARRSQEGQAPIIQTCIS